MLNNVLMCYYLKFTDNYFIYHKGIYTNIRIKAYHQKNLCLIAPSSP